MAPVRISQQTGAALRPRPLHSVGLGMNTRSQASRLVNEKRKADVSPLKKVKRPAFVDITNACSERAVQVDKKPARKAVAAATLPVVNGHPNIKYPAAHKAVTNISQNTIKNYAKLVKAPCYLKTKGVPKPKVEEVTEKIKAVSVSIAEVKSKKPDSSEKCVSSSSENSDSSLYITALEDDLKVQESVKDEVLVPPTVDPGLPPPVPEGIEDFDAENWTDPIQASNYAMDIFNYLKDRETAFPIDNYMERQVHLNSWMRALLVDWMVEVQESFELNHETLYLAVKLVDLYLAKHIVEKTALQLIGASSIFIATKYDERMPPIVADFLYICDGAYTKAELINMEKNIVKSVDYNLGIPLSYRFLRRYARCGKITMAKLTLARYILELSLMEYSLVGTSDSKLAAAALYVALIMSGSDTWTPTLEYYTGYRLADVRELAHKLNDMLHKPPKGNLATIRTKYSNKIFFEVAKTLLVDNSSL